MARAISLRNTHEKVVFYKAPEFHRSLHVKPLAKCEHNLGGSPLVVHRHSRLGFIWTISTRIEGMAEVMYSKVTGLTLISTQNEWLDINLLFKRMMTSATEMHFKFSPTFIQVASLERHCYVWKEKLKECTAFKRLLWSTPIQFWKHLSTQIFDSFGNHVDEFSKLWSASNLQRLPVVCYSPCRLFLIIWIVRITLFFIWVRPLEWC